MKFWYRLGYWLSRGGGRLLCSFRVQNGENLNAGSNSGGLVIASNHVSFLDPPLIGSAFSGPIYFFARRTLFENPVSRYLFPRINAIPVNQEKPELSILRRVVDLLRGGEKLVIFPEGERSRDGELNREGRPGIGMIVARAEVPVLPVRLFGAEKALPRGARWIRRHPVTLVVGEPIDFSDLYADESLTTKQRYVAISERIMEAIAALELTDSRGE